MVLGTAKLGNGLHDPLWRRTSREYFELADTRNQDAVYFLRRFRSRSVTYESSKIVRTKEPQDYSPAHYLAALFCPD